MGLKRFIHRWQHRHNTIEYRIYRHDDILYLVRVSRVNHYSYELLAMSKEVTHREAYNIMREVTYAFPEDILTKTMDAWRVYCDMVTHMKAGVYRPVDMIVVNGGWVKITEDELQRHVY